MKRSFTISLGSLIVLCIVLSIGLWKSKVPKAESLSPPVNNPQNVSPPNRHPDQPPSTILTPSKPNLDFDPSEFKGATQDPNVMAFLSKHRSMPQVGDLRSVGDNQQLVLNEKIIFEAKRIDDWRSMSQDGTIALAAITEEPSTTVPTDDVALSEKPKRIWLVDSHGNKRSISSPGVDASKPLIAPSANAVAFTGSRVGSGGIGAGNQLFVVDLKSGTSRIFNANRPLDDYSVTAVEWADGGKTLKLIEDHGETGGHMVMRQIRLE